MPTPRIVYVVTTALEKAATVEQLLGQLGDRPVVLHHDFDTQPGFAVRPRPNLRLVPSVRHDGRVDPWSAVDDVRRSVRFAFEHFEFDYLQLLSGSCLPTRPIEEFERHIAQSRDDAHVDWFDVTNDPNVLAGFAYRMFGNDGDLRFRMFRKLRDLYFGKAPVVRQHGGMALMLPTVAGGFLTRTLRAATLKLARGALAGRLGRVPYGLQLPPVVGSAWFGARRDIWQYLVAQAEDPAIGRFFRHKRLPAELVWPALLAGSGFRLGPSNHLIGTLDADEAPQPFCARDLARIISAPAFFARRFPNDSAAPIRRLMAFHLARSRARLVAEAKTPAAPARPDVVSVHEATPPARPAAAPARPATAPVAATMAADPPAHGLRGEPRGTPGPFRAPAPVVVPSGAAESIRAAAAAFSGSDMPAVFRHPRMV